jgi:RNase P subunit RPR2
MKHCQNCNIEFPDTSRFCKSCGSNLDDEITIQSPPVPSDRTTDSSLGLICQNCGTTLRLGTMFCKACGKPLATPPVSRSQQVTGQIGEKDVVSTVIASESFQSRVQDLPQRREPDLDRVMARKQMLGLIGSLILFVGVFTPIISLPIVGSVNYFQNGKGDGVIILALAIASLILTLTKRYRGLWFTGMGTLSVMVFTFVNFQMRMSEMQTQMESQLSGNPFRGLADMAMQSVQIQWGWALLIVGAGLVIAAAAIRTPDLQNAV